MTEPTMVERVAAALKAKLGDLLNATPLPGPPGGDPTDWSARGDTGSIDLHELARAAIAAMREPTEGMWVAGQHKIMDGADCEYLNHRAACYAWQAMIDAALQEET